MKIIKKVCNTPCKMKKRQGGPLPSFGERPALAQLISATDVDEATEEDAAEPSSDKSAPADTATNGDDEPADDQHQENSEAPATRLVNVERPPWRRPRASITTPIISTSDIFFRYHYKVLHQLFRTSGCSSDSTTVCAHKTHDDVIVPGRRCRVAACYLRLLTSEGPSCFLRDGGVAVNVCQLLRRMVRDEQGDSLNIVELPSLSWPNAVE